MRLDHRKVALAHEFPLLKALLVEELDGVVVDSTAFWLILDGKGDTTVYSRRCGLSPGTRSNDEAMRDGGRRCCHESQPRRWEGRKKTRGRCCLGHRGDLPIAALSGSA